MSFGLLKRCSCTKFDKCRRKGRQFSTYATSLSFSATLWFAISFIYANHANVASYSLLLLSINHRVGSYFEPDSALHHIYELVVVDLTVTIGVNSLEQLLDLFLAEREVVALQAHTQLIRAYSSTIVLVEVGKGRTQVALLQIVVGLQTRGNEFSVVDKTVLV